MRVLKLIGGVLAILVGVSLAGWLAYNIFIESQPSYQSSEPRKPLKALVFCAAMVVVGCVWVKGFFAKETEEKS